MLVGKPAYFDSRLFSENTPPKQHRIGEFKGDFLALFFFVENPFKYSKMLI